MGKKQARYCKVKQNLKCNECFLQGDFSQNFSMAVQDATQKMFFNAPKQATLHPFLAYVSIAEKIVPYSMCVFSDS